MYKAQIYRSKTNKTRTITKNFNIPTLNCKQKVNENTGFSKMITKHNLINKQNYVYKKQKTQNIYKSDHWLGHNEMATHFTDKNHTGYTLWTLRN